MTVVGEENQHSNKTLPKTVESLSVLLKPLLADSCSQSCHERQKYLIEIIQDSACFSDILGDLSPEQRIPLYLAVKEYLLKIVHDETDLENVIVHLPDQNKIDFCLSLYRHNPDFFKNTFINNTLVNTRLIMGSYIPTRSLCLI